MLHHPDEDVKFSYGFDFKGWFRLLNSNNNSQLTITSIWRGNGVKEQMYLFTCGETGVHL